MKHSLKIGCWNIQGLSEDESEDKHTIDFVNNNDCAVFVETWLNTPILFNNVYTYNYWHVRVLEVDLKVVLL